MNGASDTASRDTARALSAFAARLRPEQLPESVIEKSRMFIADYCAAALAGFRINGPFNRAVLEIVETASAPGDAYVICLDHRLAPEAAAYMNAVYAHGADMDDGNRKAMGHVAAHVMSAVFALADTLEGITWGQVLAALAVGYEVYDRVAAMAQPGLVHRGFHSTGTAGTVACGAACAKLLGLDEDGIYNAIGIAAIQASGLIIIAESGQANKPLNPANAARAGMISAKLAQKGVAGPVLPLESGKGWFHAMTDAVRYDMLEGLGAEYTLMECYLKPYPSCRHTHCGIEAAVAIRDMMARSGRTAEEIDSVRLHIYENAIRIAGQIRLPANSDEAKFSIHYSLAVALLTGGFTLDDLVASPTEAVRALANRTELVPDAAMEDVAKGIRGARLCVALKDGTALEKTVLLPKGEAGNPFTWDDMRRKLAACASGTGLSADGIAERVRAIAPEARFSGLEALLR